MNTKEETDARINSIMKVDTYALLDTLKNLEDKLTIYNRADEIPAWAGSVIPRMEILEMKTSKLEKKQNQVTGGTVGNNVPAQNIGEIQLEGRIFDKVKTELDTQIGTTRLSLESKVSSISIELDRLHKLLQIRPTTSELQKIVLQIQEIKRNIQGNMNELSESVELIVKDKIVAEMGSIMDKLKSIDNNSNSNMKIMLEKMNTITADMSALRVGVQNGMDLIKYQIDTATTTLTSHTESIATLKSDFEVHNEQVNEQFMDVTSNHTDLTNTVNLINEQLHSEINELRGKLLKHEKDILDIRQYNIRMEDIITKKFTAVTDAIQELSTSYLLDSEQQKASMLEMKEVIQTIQTKGDETAAQLDILIKGDILTVIGNIEARQLEDKKHVAEIEEKLGTLGLRLGKMNKTLATVQESLEPLEAGQVQQSERIDAFAFETKTNFDQVQKDMQKQVSDLVVVRDEAAVIKTIGLASDQRVKVIQSTMADLLTQTEAFGKRFADISLTIEREKLDMLKSVQEAEDSLKITMLEKHAEIEGAVQNIKENLDLMAHAADHHKQQSKGNHKDHKKHGRMVGHGKDVGNNLLHSAVEGAAIPAVSLEEQLAVAQTHAQFIGDLCINFEEVSIRRSEVPPIPNVIIENVIATTQVLTAYIANNADAESVVQVLRGNPTEVAYDDLVSLKRHQKLEIFLREINHLLDENNKQPGQVRLEAREKFMAMLRMALDLCISKHEQVIVTGNTRIGRTKIPSCIACDRPLLEKVRQDKVKDPLLPSAYDLLYRSNTANTNIYGRIDGKNVNNTLMPINTSSISLAEDSVSTFTAPQTFQQQHDEDIGLNKIIRTKDGRPKLLETKVVLPTPQRELSSSPPQTDTLNRNNTKPTSQSAYILRGGFKMPRPGVKEEQNSLNQSASMSSIPF